jgi:hypothetical protein
VLRDPFGTKKEEVTEGWRKMHSEDHCNLYSSPNIIMVMKSKRMRWVGHVACMAAMRTTYIISIGKTEMKKQLGNTGTDRRIILNGF